MAPQKKGTKAKSGKAAPRGQLHTARALREAGRRLGRTLAANRRKYLQQPLGAGAKLLSQTWTDPFGTAHKTVDGVQGWVDELRSEPRRCVKRRLQGGWRQAGEMGRDVRHTLDAVGASGCGVLGGIGEDARQVFGAVKKGGWKSIERVPGAERLAKTVNRQLQAIPERLDVATKKDIQQLMKKVAALDAKINRLSRPSDSSQDTGSSKASPA